MGLIATFDATLTTPNADRSPLRYSARRTPPLCVVSFCGVTEVRTTVGHMAAKRNMRIRPERTNVLWEDCVAHTNGAVPRMANRAAGAAWRRSAYSLHATPRPIRAAIDGKTPLGTLNKGQTSGTGRTSTTLINHPSRRCSAGFCSKQPNLEQIGHDVPRATYCSPQ